MAKKPTVTTLQSGFNSTEVLNVNFTNIREAFDNTLSLDGSTPNAMEADLDLNNNDILNAGSILINGVDYIALGLEYKNASAASAAAALVSENNAGTSATSASNDAATIAGNLAAALAAQVAAELAETNAELAETNAETAETNAAASAVTSANEATTATTQAGIATTQAGISTTKAGEASASATAASGSATDAATSATAAEAALDAFQAVYLGAQATDPTTDLNGNALTTGDWYFNTTTNVVKVYNGSAWQVASFSAAGLLEASNNLSDVSSVTTARTNLGLGTAALTASTDYATAAQGTKADTAFSWGNHATAGYASTDEALALSIALG
tara:strand:- start:228 stop:1217 length:990 start_codon:yes stop_codon:yes gene_type:complete